MDDSGEHRILLWKVLRLSGNTISNSLYGCRAQRLDMPFSSPGSPNKRLTPSMFSVRYPPRFRDGQLLHSSITGVHLSTVGSNAVVPRMTVGFAAARIAA